MRYIIAPGHNNRGEERETRRCTLPKNDVPLCNSELGHNRNSKEYSAFNDAQKFLA